MIRKQTLSAAILASIICACGFTAFTQTPADAVAEVPELVSFHEVIFKIWHEAWPDKNISMLQELQPEVENGVLNVVEASLPGILREKKEEWAKGVNELKNAGASYKEAAEAGDSTRLLNAAEELHSRFETLMRLIRPALKELDDFHSSLYMLYHYHLQEYDIEKIRLSAEELKQKMEALHSAVLPERLQSKDQDFQEAREKLSESVKLFISSLDTDSEKNIKAAIEKLHSNYEAVQNIFN